MTKSGPAQDTFIHSINSVSVKDRDVSVVHSVVWPGDLTQLRFIVRCEL